MTRLRPPRATTLLLAVLFVALATGAGSAYAGVKIATKNLKNGAVTSAKIRNATIRTVDISPATRAQLTGPAGAPGAPGTPGSPGISGYERVEETAILQAGDTFKTVSASCPPGKRILGGGGLTQDSEMYLQYAYAQSNDVFEVQAILRPGGTINAGYAVVAVAICGYVG